MNYQIFTDATADLEEGMLSGLPHIEIISMDIEVDGELFTYGPQGTLSVKEFYEMQRNDKFATTSQITPERFKCAFEPYLEQGKDILYLGFSSGMSGTMNSANIAKLELEERYPDQKILCIDTLCASVGEGFLVMEAARKQALKIKLQHMEEGWNPALGKLVIIGHGDDTEAAQKLKEEVASKFPEAEIFVTNIGPVIGSHTGPGMIALIYWGTNR